VRFVLANRLLDRAGGTEVHLLTLAEQLQRLGHEVCLYSPELGPFTDHVRRRGVDVAAELRDLPGACDVVLSQDALVVYDLAERYPSAFHAFRVCGDVFDFQFPPQLEGIVDLIVVLSDRYERLARACAVKAPVLRLRVPIDSDRLSAVAPIRPRPRRAVLLGNYLERDELISEAWGRHGVEVSRVGGSSQRFDLSAALADADIVVAKGRAALDAMACGRAVYVFDVFGGDGWVTTASYAALEADNFAGGATPRVIGVAELARDLADYDPRMGITNRDLIVQHHDARDHAIEFVKAIDVREPIERPAAPLQEFARLTSLQWSWERLAHGLQGERAEWVERIQHAEQRAADADAVAAAQVERVQHLERIAAEAEAAAEGERAVLVERVRSLEQHVAEADAAGVRHNAESESRAAQLDAMRATRTWRLASRYWRVRKRLVARRGRTTRGQ
jgi:hypothetical protein